MNRKDREDQFQVWLIHMDDAIAVFKRKLPENVYGNIDYSPASLDILEGWLLSRYSSKEDIKRESESIIFDGSARYLGEAFRKTLGGRWIINFKDRADIFYGIPQLSDMSGQEVPFSPLTTVTACFSRRTGNYFSTILRNLRKKADAGM